MALTFCTRCGHRVSTTAPKCPSCGVPPYSKRSAAESATSARVTHQPVLAKSRVTSRPRIILVLVVLAVGLAGWWLFYLPSTPTWALYTLYVDVKEHDGVAAKELIDFEGVTKSIIAASEQNEAAGKAPSEELGEELLGRGLATLMVGPIAEALKSRFQQWVDTRDESKYPVGIGPAVQAIFRLRRQGSSAFTHLTDDDGKRIDITLTRGSDGYWKITGVDGPSVREALRQTAAVER